MSVEFVGLIKATLTMRNTTGSISAPGLKVGDKVVAGFVPGPPDGWRSPEGGTGGFEAVITVDDELQVTSNGMGTANWTFLLFR